MNIKESLEYGRDTLAHARLEDPSLEAEVLLRYVLSIDRVRLFSEQERKLSDKEIDAFRKAINRRLKGEPSAYITGHREFFGMDFIVNKNVLIPRPETEILVETALEIAAKQPIKTIADIGTGSGAIAVSLATRLKKATCYAIDISRNALSVAAENARKHGVADKIHFIEGDLLQALPEAVDLITANLPYVKQEELGQVNTWGHEPASALDGGVDGLDIVRRLVCQAKDKLKPGGALLLEIGANQSDAVTDLLADTFPSSRIQLISDHAGIERVVSLALN